MYEPSKMAENAPVYPWGLSLTLDDATIEKLGTGSVPMKVGAEVTLHATVKVTACEDRQTAGDGHHRSVTLQITALAFEGEIDSQATADALYGGNKA